MIASLIMTAGPPTLYSLALLNALEIACGRSAIALKTETPRDRVSRCLQSVSLKRLEAPSWMTPLRSMCLQSHMPVASALVGRREALRYDFPTIDEPELQPGPVFHTAATNLSSPTRGEPIVYKTLFPPLNLATAMVASAA